MTKKIRKGRILVVLLIIIAGGLIFMNNGDSKIDNGDSESSSTKIKLETNRGDIIIEMASDMPITTGNFIGLVEDGTYDGVIFHRVIPGFMVQGGDPTGTGFGDSKIPKIKDEFTDNNRNIRGSIAMANAGPDTGSSQFFINLVDNSFLDDKHPVFGNVVEGMSVVESIAAVKTLPGDRPIEEIKIIKASVL